MENCLFHRLLCSIYMQIHHLIVIVEMICLMAVFVFQLTDMY